MELADPHPRFHRSWLEAADELAAAGEERHTGFPSLPVEGDFPGIDFTRASVAEPDGFAAMVRFLLEQRDPDAPRPRSYVPFTELWLAQGDEYLGRISLRHELTPALLEWGGHIGYVVRPSARRRGHASTALRVMLRLCGEMEIDPVLVTCDEDNEPSRRTIEGAGGVYEDSRDGKRRYWVPAT